MNAKITPEMMRRELVRYIYSKVFDSLDRNIKVEGIGKNAVTINIYGEKFELKLSDQDLSANLDTFSEVKLKPLFKEYLKTWRSDLRD